MARIENTASSIPSIVASVFVAARTFLLSRCLATPSILANFKAGLLFWQCAGGSEGNSKGVITDTLKISVF
jgi:hypothetical protein